VSTTGEDTYSALLASRWKNQIGGSNCLNGQRRPGMAWWVSVYAGLGNFAVLNDAGQEETTTIGVLACAMLVRKCRYLAGSVEI
jgi:hypothetical protein